MSANHLIYDFTILYNSSLFIVIYSLRNYSVGFKFRWYCEKYNVDDLCDLANDTADSLLDSLVYQ